jgi:two-component system LytT family sensor kinase
MTFALGVLLGIGLAVIVVAVWRTIRARRASGTAEAGMQSALHAATSTLPLLRRGLSADTAERAVPHLRALTGAAAVALADTRAVVAIDGEGRE